MPRGTSGFKPPLCPLSDCPSRDQRCTFRWYVRGSYTRACDGRRVTRFQCRACNRSFSTQTFRADYRHKKPRLNVEVFRSLTSKVTMRQCARVLDVNRKTVAHRLALLGDLGPAVHEALLECGKGTPFDNGPFLLDELETYEESRRLKPLTVPVLIHGPSYFVVHTAVAPLPARGGLSPALKAKKEAFDAVDGPRRSGSRRVVHECFEKLAAWLPEGAAPGVLTDLKSTYPAAIRKHLGKDAVHECTHSKQRRDWRNPLFKINLTLAMLRDGVSRLVRRTWAASKRAGWLTRHLWIWIIWRNYVRGMTNRERHYTPAMRVGLCDAALEPRALFRWRREFVALFMRQ